MRTRWIALTVAALAAALVPVLSAHAVDDGRLVNGDEQWAGQLTVNADYHCSVGIIDPQWALTAAHCLDGWSTSDSAWVGGAGPTGSAATAPQRVDRRVNEPGGSDLALLHLSKPLQLDSYLKLPDNIGWPQKCDGECPAQVYGWAGIGCQHDGTDCEDGGSAARTAEVTFDPKLTDCTDDHAKPGICSTAKARPGDSGGPLVMFRDGPRVVGVTSSDLAHRTTHANVILRLEWIRATMDVGVIITP